MLSEFIEKVKDQYAQNLPFVVYRKPSENVVCAIFQKDTQIHSIKDFTETGFVFAPFDFDQPTILLRTDKKFNVAYPDKGYTRDQTEEIVGNNVFRKAFHINLVKEGIGRIHDGAFQKVVLSRKVEEKFTSSPVDLFQKLLSIYDTAYCYLWFHPKVGTWLGATPEILLKIKNSNLTTMSLAGTQKHIENELPNWEQKELQEQALVTSYISSSLTDLVSDIKISKREPVRAGSLWHLRTRITATIEKGSLFEIIKALHPTPAVCGLPMKASKAFILEHEKYNREYYTGFLGELNIENKEERTTTLFVNLRCMQVMGDTAHIYVGGGVTKDSDPEKEWAETVAKTNTMLQVL
jgi:isochorismate synthase